MTVNNLCRFTFNEGGASATLFWWDQWLPGDMLYHDRLEQLRSEGKKIGQVALLQGSGGPIIELLGSVWTMVQALDLDLVLILVNPDHRSRWNQMLFQDAGWEQLPWELACGLPVRAMFLDVRAVNLSGSRRKRFEPLRRTAQADVKADASESAHVTDEVRSS